MSLKWFIDQLFVKPTGWQEESWITTINERLGRFTDEVDAFAQCEAAGYTAHKLNFLAKDNEFYWHDFDSLTFITAGELIIY